MSVHVTQIRRVADGSFVDAELHDSLSFGDLLDAESEFTPARFGMIKGLDARGIPPSQWPEHWHWNWVHKLARTGHLDIGSALSPKRLLGLKRESRWEGLLLATTLGHTSQLNQGGKDLIYIEYVEVAPWNLAEPLIGQVPQHKGVGRQLVELVVRLSLAMEFKGRVGLHALPQAEDFYRDRCGMTDVGPDADYSGNLRYFEFTEDQARAFLQPQGVRR